MLFKCKTIIPSEESMHSQYLVGEILKRIRIRMNKNRCLVLCTWKTADIRIPLKRLISLVKEVLEYVTKLDIS